MEGAAGSADLLAALTALREQVDGVRLPLELPGVEAARKDQHAVVAQLDDYVLPRMARLDAPLLAVVGGSTGAGKSTLLNALVGERVSEPGVLRPTTRAPVLAHHPEDAHWFTERRVLPGLVRVTGAAGDPRSLRLVATPALPQGLALLDAPDIDSVVTANRELAAQLLAAADLWVFVTSAARYADAVPWEFLRDASARSAALAVVLDRVPLAAMHEVRDDLSAMLGQQGLGDAPLFAVAESRLEDGALPREAVEPLRVWLLGLAADATSRAEVVRQTLSGAVDALRPRLERLAVAREAQDRAGEELRAAAVSSYDDAVRRVDEAMRDGSVLRGEVLARWQELVGTGEILRALESRLGRLRDRVTAAVTGRQPVGRELGVALGTGVEALVRADSDRAAERTAGAWRGAPGGAALLATGGGAALERSSPQLADRISRLVRDWQGGVLDLVRREAQGRRTTARVLAFGLNGAALVVMVAVFAHTGGLTGGEVAVAGGAGALNQKLLEALLGDQVVRELAAQARGDLRERVDALLVDERERFTRLVGEAAEPSQGADADALRAAGRAVERAR